MNFNWNNYYDNNVNIDKYIELLKKNTNEKNIENKILSIEVEYQQKILEIETLYKSPEEILKIKSKSSLVILQKELDIIKLFTKYALQNKVLEYNFFMNCLNLLLELSEILRMRLGQPELQLEKLPIINNEIIITRCSYKFCSYHDNCVYNYNLKSKNLCYQDHYVHNMVSLDLKILQQFIKQKYEHNENIVHNKEILKTINTLSFVIGHMEIELRTKCLYLPESEWEQFHIIKNK